LFIKDFSLSLEMTVWADFSGAFCVTFCKNAISAASFVFMNEVMIGQTSSNFENFHMPKAT